MIKHQAVSDDEKRGSNREALGEKAGADFGTEFDSLEEELNKFSININGDLKVKTGSLSAQPQPMQSQGSARDPLERF